MGTRNSKINYELCSNSDNNIKYENNSLKIQLNNQKKINNELNEKISKLDNFYNLHLNYHKYKINVLTEKLEKYENK